MFLAAMLLFLAQDEVRLSAVDRLSPLTSGAVVLAGRDHGKIESVGRVYGDMSPPGMIEVELLERPVVGREGCSRRRWTASFKQSPGAEEGDAVLSTVSSVPEVALGRSGVCPSGRYARLAPSVTSSEAFSALKKLDAVRRERSKIEVACSDSTPSNLCADTRTVLAELRRIRPWAILRDGEVSVIWLGTPGGVVTEVRLDPARPGRIGVSRRIPAPF